MEPISNSLLTAISPFLMARSSCDLQEMIDSHKNDDTLTIMRRKVDRYNAETGTLNLVDGYDCPLCLNRGFHARLQVEEDGRAYELYTECQCQKTRASLHRLKASGLETSIREKTFKSFRAENDWQRRMVALAKDFLANGVAENRWFFIGGAVGCGKTHICTAIVGKLIETKSVRYMTWPGDAARIKALVNDEYEYAEATRKLKNIEVLYIDDFFKPINGMPPTQADVRLAYEIINHRYINRLVTIISSERYLGELMDIDEATASRIAECTKGTKSVYMLTLGRDRKKNQRIPHDDPI